MRTALKVAVLGILMSLSLPLADQTQLSGFGLSEAAAQRQGRERRNARPKAEPDAKTEPSAESAPVEAGPTAPPVVIPEKPVPPAAPERPERIEADVSSRSVSIKLGYSGTEIIVFGSVDNSRQPSAESGYYDVVVVLEGQSTPLVVRSKSNVAGLWMNTAAFTFDRVPSYYAIASTRPIEEIADTTTLSQSAIGFEHVRIRPKEGPTRTYSEEELKVYRDAIVRLKAKDRLYQRADYDVTFIGRSLFRTKVSLPANVAVGPVEARAYLFRDGKLLSQFGSRVMLQRAGLELWLHAFANRFPLFYGLFTVAVAVAAGLLASTFFRTGSH